VCSRRCALALSKQKPHTPKDEPQDSAPSVAVETQVTETRTADTVSVHYVGPALTPEEMAVQRGIDLRRWKCVQWNGTDWEGFIKDKRSQKLVKTLLRRCQAKFVLNVEASIALDEIARLSAEVIVRPRKFTENFCAKNVKQNCVVLSISDLHIGKPGVSAETGCAAYTPEIAETLFHTSAHSLLERTKDYNPQTIVLVVGNDFLHIDNPQGMTTGGTRIDYSSTYHENFLRGFRMVEQAIARCREYAPRVVVIPVAGNHDANSVWHLGHSLELAYRATPSVEVWNAPVNRKYFTWGQCAFMFTHGDAPRSTNYAQIFAADQPKIWGATKFHEVFLGHLHKTQVDEFPGCIVRRISSLTPSDIWHAAKFYIGNLRRAEAFVYNAEHGLIATAIFNVSEGM
jgi:hypothetical protein